jgi:enterochelin esterase-like enzyme
MSTIPHLSGIFLGVSLLIGGSIILTRVQGQQGQIIYDTVAGKSLENNLLGDSPRRSTIVYLPPTYAKTQKRYPVVYLLHGNGGINLLWVNGRLQGFNILSAMDSLIRSGKTIEMIIVMPDANNRFRGSHYANSSVTGNWLDFIAKDIIDYIDRKYRTIANPSSRGLAGHSMGGRGCLNIAMKSPGVFGAIYAMSAGVMAFDSFPPVTEADWRQIIASPTATDNASIRVLGLSAAHSPNPQIKPQLVDFPYEIVDGNLRRRHTIWQKWLEHDPFHVARTRSTNLRQLRGLAFDVGTSDRFLNANRLLSGLLRNHGIVHVYEEYEGDHVNRIAERLATRVLPFFSETLVAK